MLELLKKSSKEKKRRHIVCLCISILIHIIIIYALIILFPSIKKISYYKEIRNVVLSPPLMIPEIYDEPSQSELFHSSLPLPRKGIYKSGYKIEEGTKAEKENGENLLISSYVPPLIELNLTPDEKKAGQIKKSFSLSLRTNNEEDCLSEQTGSLKPDFLQYLYPESTLQGKYVKEKSRNNLIRLSSSIKLKTPGIDIVPWAELVVSRIQSNWLLSSYKESIKKGSVKIAVSVNKEGEILSLEIVESNQPDFFLKSALSSITSSQPFPRLPVEFSDNELLFYLNFEWY